MEAKLMKMSYFDPKAETRLETYADTIVIEKEGNISYLAAVRLGGYPESVKGMSEAIYGGGSVSIVIDDRHITVYSRLKQYRKEFAHDGIYAESTLLIQDEEQRTDNGDDDGGNQGNYSKPRRCYLFCEQGDSDRLFEELDKKTSVPLIPEFKDYILGELQNRGILKQLQVISSREKFDVWALELSKDEENIISVVNDGLKSGAISIPGANDNEFPGLRFRIWVSFIVSSPMSICKVYRRSRRYSKQYRLSRTRETYRSTPPTLDLFIVEYAADLKRWLALDGEVVNTPDYLGGRFVHQPSIFVVWIADISIRRPA